MKELLLTNGSVTLVDDADFEELSRHNWRLHRAGSNAYAVATIHGEKTSMHRLLLGLVSGEYGDHVDGNSLNNQRSNLRKCSAVENARNRAKVPGSSSPYKGVCRHQNKWQVCIRLNATKRQYLGHYSDPVEAARVYDMAAKEYFGEFARLNFPVVVPERCMVGRCRRPCTPT